MDEDLKQAIVQNLDFLSQNTSNVSVLLFLLFKEGVLTNTDYEEINVKESNLEKCTTLYSQFREKLSANTTILFKCLEMSKNLAVLEILRGTPALKKTFILHEIVDPTEHYIGRESEFKLIQNCLEQSLCDCSLSFIGITGLSGIGKSQLAKFFAKFFHEKIKGHCIWINAESSEQIYNSFCSISENANITLLDANDQPKDIECLSEEVYTVLSEEKCLLVFDNLQSYDQDALKSLVQYTIKLPPSKPRPFVILTSINRKTNRIFGYRVTRVHLNTWTEKEAYQFLISSLRSYSGSIRSYFKSEIKYMYKRFDYFPLALQQVVQFIRDQIRYHSLEYCIQKCLRICDEESKLLLNYDLPKNCYYFHETTYVTLSRMLSKIESLPDVGSNARNLIEIIAFLHPEAIDSEFLKFLIESPDLKSDTIFILRDYSLCQLKRNKGTVLISVHPLVQEVSRIKMIQEEKYCDKLDRILSITCTMLDDNKMDWSQMIHLGSMWSHAAKVHQLAEKYKYLPTKFPLICDSAIAFKNALYSPVESEKSKALKMTNLQPVENEPKETDLGATVRKNLGESLLECGKLDSFRKPHFLNAPIGNVFLCKRRYFNPSDPLLQFTKQVETHDAFKQIVYNSGKITIEGKVYETDNDDLEHMGFLGKGVCGHVLKMRHSPSNNIIAVKQMLCWDNWEEYKEIMLDLRVVLQSHECPYIVQCLGCLIVEANIWICMELMSICMDKLLKHSKEPFHEEILGKVAVATVKALHYLIEKYGVIHRNIKPSNILMDDAGNIKVCDIVISGRLVDLKTKTRSSNCIAYMSPERIDPPDPSSRPNYDSRADIWSLGITLVELATGNNPYGDCTTGFEVMTRIVSDDPPSLPTDKKFSKEFRSFVSDCLAKDYKQRPEYSHLLTHAFIRKCEEMPVDAKVWHDFMYAVNHSKFFPLPYFSSNVMRGTGRLTGSSRDLYGSD